MKIKGQSHTDHGLSPAVLAFILARFADKQAFFIESFEIPADVCPEGVPCGLYGPTMGDPPIHESEVEYVTRGIRQGQSRMVNKPMRPTRTLTVIAGPDGDEPCILYTAFGGPLAPREPHDSSLSESELAESKAFWAQHALSSQ